ncbi:Hypothetical predicted protein [Mytilus galloprovincialis]|uniref:DUF7869 domain-containing protein n=1 Tax=Mytilus galloprovincialis TaxID=29158 RepID=A0A8B6GZR5_MYTGA|nr:Hypothetical predicted protein [Mytilus galloprovincialis]
MEIEDLDEIFREYLHIPPSNNFNDEDNDNINDNENNELEDTEPVEHISETDEIAQAAAAFVQHQNGDNKIIYINNEGENINRYMTGYLAWRVLTGQHQKISLMMQFPGHTKCLVDAGFGQAKKLFRRSNCDTVSHLADVFRKSSSSNEVV